MLSARAVRLVLLSSLASAILAAVVAMIQRPTEFKPNFFLDVVLDFPYPVEKVFAAMGGDDDQNPLCKNILLSDIAHDCNLLARDTVDVSGPLEEALVRTAPASTNGTGFPRQQFSFKETIKIIPGLSFLNIVVELQGSNTWDAERKVILYETRAESQNVTVKKTRFFESIDGGKATRYTEKIVGQCPWYFQPIVQSQASKAFNKATALYHTVLE